MSTDFNNTASTLKTNEAKLLDARAKVSRFCYEEQALEGNSDSDVFGVSSYNYNNTQNIPVGTPTTLQMSETVLSKGLRSQGSSFTRMGVNHFWGRASYNINKLAIHFQDTLTMLKNFFTEGSNAWSPTATYAVGDLVYMQCYIGAKKAKRTFECKVVNTNLAPMDTSNWTLTNTDYWVEVSGTFASVNATSATINGTLTVNGDIVQSGSSYETYAEKLYTKKDLIFMRDGAVSGLASGEVTGLEAKLYDGVHDGQLIFDITGTARVGDKGDTKALACREEEANMVSGKLVKWNAVSKVLESSAYSDSDITDRQTKSITPITIGGQPQSTVETALQALASVSVSKDIVVVTGNIQYSPIIDCVFRIQGTAVITVNDPSTFGLKLTAINETALAQSLSLNFDGSNTILEISKGETLELVWNGSTFVYSGIRIPVGSLHASFATVASKGYFLCDGTDTTGTDNELSTRYPNLYKCLGNSNVLPDLRECTVKGAGLYGGTCRAHVSSTGLSVGEFLDDKLQTHIHYVSATNASGAAGFSKDVGVTGYTSNNSTNSAATTEVKSVGVNWFVYAL